MAVLEPTRTWAFTHRKTGEERIYQQSELTIDGEAHLIGLAARVIAALGKDGFPFDQVKEAFGFGFGEDLEIAWDKVGNLLAIATAALPWASAECAAILLGEFPTDENGRPNKEWPATLAFLRASIHFTDLVEMLKTFADQNDIERLATPFVSTLIRMGRSPAATSPASGAASTSSSLPDTTEGTRDSSSGA